MATIYAAALNFKEAYRALEPAMHSDPYKAPPRAPVLYIKPPHSRICDGEPILVPPGTEALRAGGTLAIEIGRTARHLTKEDALTYVAGYRVANDIGIPQTSYYRPAVKELCRDGFCPISNTLADTTNVSHPEALTIHIFVNNVLACVANMSDLVRNIPVLLADVTEFMTLTAGDLLLVGAPACSPLIRAGDHVRVEIDGVGTLDNPVVAGVL
jgi:5-oxopent-3-ene-1,2,5-tricarboxylate decarboxylase/2-hydroxyhepta-2,4-diene-1,7-dioate isomerase